jgi:hypothetical protein
MDDNKKLKADVSAALVSEMYLLKDMIDNLEDVRIYGICKHLTRDRDVIDLPDYFTNFPFDWKTEIKVLLTDALSQYEQQIYTS